MTYRLTRRVAAWKVADLIGGASFPLPPLPLLLPQPPLDEETSCRASISFSKAAKAVFSSVKSSLRVSGSR